MRCTCGFNFFPPVFGTQELGIDLVIEVPDIAQPRLLDLMVCGMYLLQTLALPVVVTNMSMEPISALSMLARSLLLTLLM